MILPVQLRMARAALNWTVRELATRTGVNKNTISRFEAEKDILAGSLREIEKVLLEAGIRFIDADDETGPGVRVSEDRLQAGLKKRSQK